MNSKLKVLNLSRCNISDVGAMNISEMLAYNTTLVSLLLHWNDIWAKGATQIFHSLIENDSLQILDLSYNSLREKPIIQLEQSPNATDILETKIFRLA